MKDDASMPTSRASSTPSPKTRARRTSVSTGTLPSVPTDLLSSAFLELAPDAIVVTDTTGHILLANHQTEMLFGYTRPELLGQHVEVLLPHRFHARHRRHRATYVANPHTRPMGARLDLFAQRQNGSEFPVEVSLSPFQVGEDLLVITIVRDITERRVLEQQAQASRQARLQLLQVVLDTLPCGVYLVRGHEARLVLANRMVETVWGGSWMEGQPLADFLTMSGIRIYDARARSLVPEHLATMQAVRGGHACVQQQEVIRHADGSQLSVLVSAFPLAPELLMADALADARSTRSDGTSGRPSRLIAVEALALVVQEDVSVLTDAERVKDEFIALAAHELRNPMASILGFAKMLQPRVDAHANTSFPPEWQQEAAECVLKSTQRLVALTDDLLDVTRLQAGRLELYREPSDLVALARRMTRRLSGATTQHELRLEAVADYIVVNMDVKRIEQVLSNLIHNAIKYSPAGGVITVSVSEDTQANHGHLAVSDHGIGIPASDLGQLFGRFARAENARQSGIEGTGLGLFLCRELIECHGGQIWCESVEGQGSTFTLTLPLAALDANAPES
jgi:PAS domain S-box-containing protein